MFERNSLRLNFKGKSFFYQAEQVDTHGSADQCHYAILFPSLKKAKAFDKASRKGHMTVKNYFGSYHQVFRTDFKFQESNLTNQADETIYSGLLTVQEAKRKS